MIGIIHLLLALVGLGFLIFIHELGHYLVAKKMGMKIEVFAIGFGKPLWSWERKGVKWQIGYIPGGYVKIADMDKRKEGTAVPGSFFSFSPWKRIAVALAGVTANILFGLLLFTFLWLTGGQEKFFAQTTNVIGAIDPHGALYNAGIRVGDKITSWADKNIQGFSTLFTNMVLEPREHILQGNKINYWDNQTTPFSFDVGEKKGMERILSLGIAPASYTIFQNMSAPNAPLTATQIAPGDRILWVNGELIFSNYQLSQVLNARNVLVSFIRNSKKYTTCLPLFPLSYFHLQKEQKEELEDLQHAAKISSKTVSIYSLPYLLSYDAVVQEPLSYVNEQMEETVYVPKERMFLSQTLQKEDKIIAINGKKVISNADVLLQLQKPQALIILQKGKESLGRWDTADDFFFSPSQMASLKKIIDSFSTDSLIEKEEDCMLLPPVDLIPAASLAFNKPTKAAWEERISRKQAEIEKKVEEEEERKGHLQRLEAEQKKLVLGGIFHDKKVVYNPYPWILVQDAFIQTAKTVLQLFEGGVSPKQVMGPVGMIQHLQSSWKSSLKEGVYWLGMISLNLACLNLLPLPIFDGGHVLFYLLEAITGKRLGQKTMERLAFLCMVLLILFILYVTYQDVMRLFQTLFRS